MKKTMTLKERVEAPSPRFFRRLRNAGLLMAAVSAAILAAPVSLPAIMVTAAGYMSVVGGVISAVSQATVNGERDEQE